MFTGIIQFVFTAEIDLHNGQICVHGTKEFLDLLTIGCSVAIDGICLTVAKITSEYCMFQVSPETIVKTYLEILPKISERKVNIELAVKAGDHLNGHVISGHIYSTGKVESFDDLSQLVIKLSTDNMTRVTYKGSIAINGISLTVAKINKSSIMIAIIPETLKRTTFGLSIVEQTVNIEFDIHDYNREVRDHSYYMRLAIQEGEMGRATTSPNPWVGCVIVFNDSIIGKGYHKKAGEDHAEVIALNSCCDSPLGSTLYCTLEPCIAFSGKRTQSCVDKIIEYGITTVVIGIEDPDPKVTGKGIEALRKINIEVLFMRVVDVKVYEEVKFSLRQYIHHRQTGMPWIIAKIALTVDGCYRDANGSDKWITHAGSRQEVYRLWSESQAVIMGASTVQKDNPEITTNDSKELLGKENIVDTTCTMPFNFKKVVIDGNCLTSTHHKIFSSKDASYNAQVLTSNPEKWKDTHAKVIEISDNRDLRGMMSALVKANNENIVQCLVEGGGIIHNSFFKAGLVNEIVIFKGSKIFGVGGYHWNMPSVDIDLINSKMITYKGENNTMERYLVKQEVHIPPTLKSSNMKFDDVQSVIREFRNGGLVVVVDDKSRENEGDLIGAASLMTESQMAEMIDATSGIVCVPIEKSRAAKLNLSLAHPPGKNTDHHGTAYTERVDHKLTGTGISAADRLMTVKALASELTVPDDLNRPGHVFPLIANSGGLAERRGHTEAAIALCQLAGIYPRVAVIGELKNQGGSIKKDEEVFTYARNNSMPIISVDQLAEEVKKLDTIKILASCNLKLEIGDLEWKQICFDAGSGQLPLAHTVLVYPSDFDPGNDLNLVVPVRIHSECFTGDVLRSELCDCGKQLENSMKHMADFGCGIIVFPADHEGRGIGRIHKCKTYALKKDEGLSTFEANRKLGFSDDSRTYDDVPKMLSKLGITNIHLFTENPKKINVFDGSNVDVVSFSPMLTDYSIHSERYLSDKRIEFKRQQVLIHDNTHGKREDLMNKIFPEVDDLERNSKFKIDIVYSSWHEQYITRMRNRIKYELCQLGIKEENITEYNVPGSAELTYGVSNIIRRNQKVAPDDRVDGAVIIGILIKGDTYHFEAAAAGVFANVGSIRDATGFPIINSALACMNYQQVEERIEGKKSTLEYIARSMIKLILDRVY